MTPDAAAAPSAWQRMRASFPRPQSFRSWTIDANDGIIGTSGILEGFAGAGRVALGPRHRSERGDDHRRSRPRRRNLGGGRSRARCATRAGGGGTRAARSRSRRGDRRAHGVLRAQGPRAVASTEVAEQLTRHDALAAQLESEHGIEEVMPPTRPVVEGVTSGIAFALGAAVPLAITLAVSAAVESWAILVAAVASLTLRGVAAPKGTPSGICPARRAGIRAAGFRLAESRSRTSIRPAARGRTGCNGVRRAPARRSEAATRGGAPCRCRPRRPRP